MMRGPIGLILGLAALGWLATAAAQAPGEKKDPDEPRPVPPGAGPVEAAIALAEQNHPDVRIAEAKVRVAEAELAQVKLQVAQRVFATHAAVKAARVRVVQAEQENRRVQTLIQRGAAPASASTEGKVAEAHAALAAAEAELRVAQGIAPGKTASDRASPNPRLQGQFDTIAYRNVLLAYLQATQSRDAVHHPPSPGSPLEQLRSIGQKRVRLDLKSPVPFDQALEALEQASGLSKLTVRAPEWASAKFLKEPPMVGPLVGEQTTAAWLQLILDDFNREVAAGKVLPQQGGKYDVYIRDYGLLITRTDLAPPGAPLLVEFLRFIPGAEEKKK